jgi:hypothetical protein
MWFFPVVCMSVGIIIAWPLLLSVTAIQIYKVQGVLWLWTTIVEPSRLFNFYRNLWDSVRFSHYKFSVAFILFCFHFCVLPTEVAEGIAPRHRFMSAYEQKVEPPDRKWQYLLFAAEPYETIAFKVNILFLPLVSLLKLYIVIWCNRSVVTKKCRLIEVFLKLDHRHNTRESITGWLVKRLLCSSLFSQ